MSFFTLLTMGRAGEIVGASTENTTMGHETVRDNPTCPVCELEVLSGDHVIFAHGELVHMNCRLASGHLTDSVTHALRHNAGAEYCQSCLARMLHQTYEHYRLRTMGTCSICGNHWTTVRAHPRSIGGGTVA